MKNLLSQPKNTFLNLSNEKRALIETVLVKEFATKGYQKASLNSIVKSLNIAKGSLYQYFDNKESIFLYVFEQFTQLVKRSVSKPGQIEIAEENFWKIVKGVMCAGIRFIDEHPLYFQLYQHVLYEENIPRREELIDRVRLFSKEYFGPMIVTYQKKGFFVQTPPSTIIFIIDAVMDRFFQGYARKHLDGGLGISNKKTSDIDYEIDQIVQTLESGIKSRH